MNFFRTAALTLCVHAAVSFAKPCVFTDTFEAKTTASELLVSANEKINQARNCEAAKLLVQVLQNFPADSIKANGLFTLMKLQIDMGQPKDAVNTYKLWPWETEIGSNIYNPWNFVPSDQEEAAHLMVWKLFASLIPVKKGRCLDNPLTHKCDSGEGLDRYDAEFEAQFPESPHIEEMRKITTLFYRHRLEHELMIFGQYASTYRGFWKSGVSKRRALRAAIAQAEQIRAMTRPEDQNEIEKILEKHHLSKSGLSR